MSREVLVGVCGGVAAFKTAALVSQMVQAGYRVQTILTKSAGQFVGAATFSALTGRKVVQSLFDPAYHLGAHIELASQAELLLIAPATANIVAKMAQGLADDLLSTTYLAFDGPVLIAPAMNAEMWGKPSVQRNVQQLKDDGVQMIGPEKGWLSCRQQGAGRMSEPNEILAEIQRILPMET
jgi:phosphopantothenoylcysteine decarboxylase/phosphopantothenate--cysteine ligase